MNYSQIMARLESRGIMPDRPPSLEPTRQGLARLGLKIDPRSVIVVAGTNGKGSICATLERLLLTAGERVGLYTSPHLVKATERIRVAGQDVSEALFCEVYERVAEATSEWKLSHFEILTLMAAWIFFSGEKIPKADRVILEVGLGGTWDSTNAIPHSMAIIASLGLDHQNLLGTSLLEIAANKFGIVTPGATVVHSPLPPDVVPLAREIQAKTGSFWHPSVPFEFQVEPGPEFWLQTAWGKAPLALPGKRGAQNTATALTAFHALGYSPEHFLSTLSQVQWPGRMERIRSETFPCPVYLSGDHNPQGIESLLELLPHYPRKHLHLLLGVGKDKDMEGILRPLSELTEASIYLTETPFRGRSLWEYGDWLKRARGAWASPKVAFEKILATADAEDLIVVTGSLYLVGLLSSRNLQL